MIGRWHAARPHPQPSPSSTPLAALLASSPNSVECTFAAISSAGAVMSLLGNVTLRDAAPMDGSLRCSAAPYCVFSSLGQSSVFGAVFNVSAATGTQAYNQSLGQVAVMGTAVTPSGAVAVVAADGVKEVWAVNATFRGPVANFSSAWGYVVPGGMVYLPATNSLAVLVSPGQATTELVTVPLSGGGAAVISPTFATVYAIAPSAKYGLVALITGAGGKPAIAALDATSGTLTTLFTAPAMPGTLYNDNSFLWDESTTTAIASLINAAGTSSTLWAVNLAANTSSFSPMPSGHRYVFGLAMAAAST